MAFIMPLRQQNTRWKHRMMMGSCGRLTIKDRAGEKHQELDEQVLLLGADLVPAETLPPVLDIAVAETLLDVGVEPFFRHGAVVLGLFGRAPEL